MNIYYKNWKEMLSGNDFPWHTESSTDTQYRISLIDGVTYIDFRAAHSNLDWFMAFWFWKRRVMGLVNTRAHAGFTKKWNSICKAVVENTMSGKVIVRGYSNGAALATLCYLVLQELRYNVTAYTYALPHLLSRRNVKKINFTDYHLTINSGDLVTQLPPKFMFYGDIEPELILGNNKCYLPKYHADSLYTKQLLELS